jgi:anti-sigma-K factor RskA
VKCDGFGEESYAMYAIGSAEEPTRSEIESHLQENCETCASELEAFSTIWHAIALETPDAKPSSSLRRDVIGQFGNAPLRKSGWRWVFAGTAFAVALTMAFLGGLKWGAVRAPGNPAIVFAPRAALPGIKTQGIETPSLPVAPPEPERVAQTNSPGADNSELSGLREELRQERARSAELAEKIADLGKPALPPAPVERTPVETVSAETQELRSRLTSASRRVTELERELVEARALLDLERRRRESAVLTASLVTSPSLRIIPLKGTERSKASGGRVLIAGTSQMLFVGSNFPALPGNRVYQLWLIRSNAPAIASAGTFRPDAAGGASIQLNSVPILAGVTAVSVTDEPAGGSAQPTGSKWVIGL